LTLTKREIDLKKILIFIINIYRRFISPIKTGKCRFYPTCSEYAVQSIEKYGAAKGMLMAVKRVLKCHPFHPGGYDPVK
jgi:putative membrane protein insertion efficiency factor